MPNMPTAAAISTRCGATLYHLLTGSVPFPGTNHVEVVESKNRGEFEPASLLNPEVPPELDRILTRMLARDPRHRYQTASELIVDLERAHLVAAVPSFADPERVRQDPWMQAYLASTAEPTHSTPTHPNAHRRSHRWIALAGPGPHEIRQMAPL